jgi:hypothetical protein|tara:strand:- start:318 stop:431 length:114 start_codon:yes stop_codon:yes gene_type:complete
MVEVATLQFENKIYFGVVPKSGENPALSRNGDVLCSI